jgi:hypothetical protein
VRAVATIGILAGVFFALALVRLSVFFIAKSKLADNLSNWAFLAFEILMIPVILEIHRRYVDHSALTWIATVIGLAAMVVLIVSSLLVGAGRVTFARVGAVQAGAFAVFAVWIAATSWFALAFGGLPAGLAWLGFVAIVVTLGAIAWMMRDRALVRGERPPNRAEMAMGVVPFIALAAWLIWLGASL